MRAKPGPSNRAAAGRSNYEYSVPVSVRFVAGRSDYGGPSSAEAVCFKKRFWPRRSSALHFGCGMSRRVKYAGWPEGGKGRRREFAFPSSLPPASFKALRHRVSAPQPSPPISPCRDCFLRYALRSAMRAKPGHSNRAAAGRTNYEYSVPVSVRFVAGRSDYGGPSSAEAVCFKERFRPRRSSALHFGCGLSRVRKSTG